MAPVMGFKASQQDQRNRHPDQRPAHSRDASETYEERQVEFNEWKACSSRRAVQKIECGVASGARAPFEDAPNDMV
jgi:hypothetical protein